MATETLDRAMNGQAANWSVAALKKGCKSAARTWPGKGLFTLLDQGLISGAGFVMTILLARTLTPRTYGTFALGYEVFLFFTILYGAFILEPLAVFGSSIYRASLQGYMRVLLRIHLVAGAAVVLLVGISAWICAAAGAGSGMVHALLGASLAAPCVLLFWLVRRAFYVELIPREAVLGAAVYFAVVVGGLFVLYRFGALSPAKAFLLMALGGMATAATILVRLKARLGPGAPGPRLGSVVRTHWKYGRWAVGSALTIWISASLYYPLLGSLRGLAEAGKLKALMNFASPVSQVFAALSLLSLPYAARIHHRHGAASARRLAWKLTALYASGTMLYWAIVVVWHEPIVRVLYAGRYEDVASLIPWVALGSILRISATAQAIALRAMQSPALVFVAYGGSSIAAFLIGVPCAWRFGLRGAVIAVAISSGVALIVGLAMVHRRSSAPENLTSPRSVLPGSLA